MKRHPRLVGAWVLLGGAARAKFGMQCWGANARFQSSLTPPDFARVAATELASTSFAAVHYPSGFGTKGCAAPLCRGQDATAVSLWRRA